MRKNISLIISFKGICFKKFKQICKQKIYVFQFKVYSALVKKWASQWTEPLFSGKRVNGIGLNNELFR